MSDKRRPKRYSMSVSGKTYDRLRAALPSTSLQKFVDGILASALDDPAILDRVSARCGLPPGTDEA
jgi:hypothetical protein